MSYLDRHPQVVEWASEEFCIPYRSPIDGEMHRYFPDFWVKKIINGVPQYIVIEVKPKSQTIAPTPRKNNRSKSYIQEVCTWGINSAKWKAAREHCDKRGWKFELFTEDDLGIIF